MANGEPSPGEFRNGQEAYMRYLTGIAILHDPDSDFSRDMHQSELSSGGLEVVIVTAENLIYSGARRVIKYSNPPNKRSGPEMEHNFDDALPNMWDIVDATFDRQASRIEVMGIATRALRPAPFTHKKTYHLLAHSRKPKLQALRLMGDLTPAAILVPELEDRDLTRVGREQRAA